MFKNTAEVTNMQDAIKKGSIWPEVTSMHVLILKMSRDANIRTNARFVLKLAWD